MAATLNLKGLLIGAFVGDASSVNVHWIYPNFFPDAYRAFIKDVAGKPEFSIKIYNPFYRGQPSPYGEQCLVLINSLVECRGWDKQDYKKKLYKAFGPESRYTNKTPVENPLVGNPIQGGHSNQSTTYFVERYNNHGEFTDSARPGDTYADGFVKAVIIAAFYLGKPEYFDIVKECVECSQNSPEATNTSLATAELFEAVFITKGELTSDVILGFVKKFYNQDHVSEEIQEKFDILNESWNRSFYDYSQETGIHCGLPAALLVSLHALYNALKSFSSPQDIFVNAIRKNTLIGGCSCSRNIFLGGIIGGMLGVDAIPNSWIDKTDLAENVFQLIDKIN